MKKIGNIILSVLFVVVGIVMAAMLYIGIKDVQTGPFEFHKYKNRIDSLGFAGAEHRIKMSILVLQVENKEDSFLYFSKQAELYLDSIIFVDIEIDRAIEEMDTAFHNWEKRKDGIFHNWRKQ